MGSLDIQLIWFIGDRKYNWWGSVGGLGKIRGFHKVQRVLSCLLQLDQGNSARLGIYNMLKEVFCWQQMGLGLTNDPNTSRMSFPIKEFLWYFQEELAVALHPCRQKEVHNASLGLGCKLSATSTVIIACLVLVTVCSFLTPHRGMSSNHRITPVTLQGEHSQCSEADPCQCGIGTNIGSQLLVSSAARHCLLSSCISLPAPNTNSQPCPCQPHVGHPWWCLLSTGCWKSSRSLQAKPFYGSIIWFNPKLTLWKVKKLPTELLALLYSVTSWTNVPSAGTCFWWWQGLSDQQPCFRSKACKQNQLVQNIHLTPNNYWPTQGSATFICFYYKGLTCTSRSQEPSYHSSTEPLQPDSLMWTLF